MLERLKARGERDWGWDGWMASLTQWAFWVSICRVWANFRRQWKTEKPGLLQSNGSQRVRHDFATRHKCYGQQIVNKSTITWSQTPFCYGFTAYMYNIYKCIWLSNREEMYYSAYFLKALWKMYSGGPGKPFLFFSFAISPLNLLTHLSHNPPSPKKWRSCSVSLLNMNMENIS